MAVTITEVAKRCGKSITTVSHVLRNGKSAAQYSEQTRQLIHEVAKELDYMPNFFASQMQKQNRKVIMLGFGGLHDAYASTIADAFGRTAAERGYTIFSATLGYSKSTADYESMLGTQGILALALIGYASSQSLSDGTLLAMAAKGVKIVTIGRPVSAGPVSQVLYENEKGVHSAIDHLLAQGARRFWLVGCSGDQPSPWDVTGQRGVIAKRYLKQVSPESEIVSVVLELEHRSARETREQIKSVLSQQSCPDAALCFSDPIAWGLIRAMADVGLVAGRDIAVVGYNDNDPSAEMVPALSTVRIPMADMGRIAANLLIDTYEGREALGTTINLSTDLVVRETS